jgi:hypothetical protein
MEGLSPHDLLEKVLMPLIVHSQILTVGSSVGGADVMA